MARKIIGVLAVIAGIILGIIAIVTNTPDVKDYLAGGVIADAVGLAVLLL
jgi:hypothetical protein